MPEVEKKKLLIAAKSYGAAKMFVKENYLQDGLAHVFEDFLYLSKAEMMKGIDHEKIIILCLDGYDECVQFPKFAQTFRDTKIKKVTPSVFFEVFLRK